MDKTITYYNQHAKEFVSTTIAVDFKANQDKFRIFMEKIYLILAVVPDGIQNIFWSQAFM